MDDVHTVLACPEASHALACVAATRHLPPHSLSPHLLRGRRVRTQHDGRVRPIIKILAVRNAVLNKLLNLIVALTLPDDAMTNTLLVVVIILGVCCTTRACKATK